MGAPKGATTIEAIAEKVGKENFSNPRDQYIYSRHYLTPVVLSKIWNIKARAIKAQMSRDRKSGIDWHTARQEHWRHVTTKAQEIIEEQALDDAENTATLYRSMIGIILAKCGKALKTSESNETFTIARTLKACHDLDERLTGAKAAKAIFDSQIKELEWFANLIEQNVQDPDLVRRIAWAIEARKSIKTTIEIKAYENVFQYAKSPHESIDKVIKAVEIIDENSNGEDDENE